MRSLHLTFETEDGTTTHLELADCSNIWIRRTDSTEMAGSLYWSSTDGLTLGHWPDGTESEWVETPTIPAETLAVTTDVTAQREEQD